MASLALPGTGSGDGCFLLPAFPWGLQALGEPHCWKFLLIGTGFAFSSSSVCVRDESVVTAMVTAVAGVGIVLSRGAAARVWCGRFS